MYTMILLVVFEFMVGCGEKTYHADGTWTTNECLFIPYTPVGYMEMSHNKTKTKTFARPTKAVNIQLVDEFEVGENVYDALLYHMKQCVESGDVTGWDFHVIDDSIELPTDGVLR